MGVRPRQLLMLLALCGGVGMAGATEPKAVATHESVAPDARVTTRPSAATRPTPPPSAVLDLKLGDASRYFPAGELAKPFDERLEEIIVNGRRPDAIPDRRDVPLGIFPSLKYAATHPLDAWRIITPVPNFQIPDRSIDDSREPPGTFRGRILEPGAIYD